jgi:hypothetical protein
MRISNHFSTIWAKITSGDKEISVTILMKDMLAKSEESLLVLIEFKLANHAGWSIPFSMRFWRIH